MNCGLVLVCDLLALVLDLGILFCVCGGFDLFGLVCCLVALNFV